MTTQSQKARQETRTYTTRNQNQSQASQVSQVTKPTEASPVQPSISATSDTQLRTRKQRQKEHGRRLAQLMSEKRARGEITNKPKISKSDRAGIYFPVTKFIKKMKQLHPRTTIRSLSGVLISAVLEYLTAEVLELAGNVSIQFKRKRIVPRHIFLAVKNDQELELLLKDTVLTQSGTVPGIHPSLLTTKTSKIPRKQDSQVQEKSEEEESVHNEEAVQQQAGQMPQNQEELNESSKKRKTVDENNNEAQDGSLEGSMRSNSTSTPSMKKRN